MRYLRHDPGMSFVWNPIQLYHVRAEGRGSGVGVSMSEDITEKKSGMHKQLWHQHFQGPKNRRLERPENVRRFRQCVQIDRYGRLHEAPGL